MYIPFVNYLLMCLCIIIIAIFETSDRLGQAYGAPLHDCAMAPMPHRSRSPPVVTEHCPVRTAGLATRTESKGTFLKPGILYSLHTGTPNCTSTPTPWALAGIAVLADMLLTTHFLTMVMLFVWKLPVAVCLLFYVLFAPVEATYWSATLGKVPTGAPCSWW